ncbi:hypothetical protein ACFFRR_000837 [Megaselia abdita]
MLKLLPDSDDTDSDDLNLNTLKRKIITRSAKKAQHTRRANPIHWIHTMPNGQKTIECKICSIKSFVNIKDLRNHFKNHHNNEISLQKYSITNCHGFEMTISDSESDDETPSHSFSCKPCKISFNRRYKILDHQEKDHSQEDLTWACDKCPMKFISLEVLNHHIKNICNNELKTNTCEQCNEKFIWANNLNAHNIGFHVQNFCLTCNKAFAKPKDLKRHMVSHRPDEEKLKCPDCGKVFNRNDNMKYHMRKVHGYSYENSMIQSQYFCDVCNKNFSSKNYLSKHNNEMHLPQKVYSLPYGDKIGECKICGYRTPSTKELKSHLASHSDVLTFENLDFENNPMLNTENGENRLEAIQRIILKILAESYDGLYSVFSNSGLELDLNHSETESEPEEPLYQCDVCSELFNRKYKAFLHQSSDHATDPSMKSCQYCSRKFCSQQLLEMHLRDQCENLEKKYSCDKCNLKFYWEENMRNHDRKHKKSSNQGDQVCEICNKAFTKKKDLDRHKIIHMPEEQKLRCPQCYQAFNRKDALQGHILRVHGPKDEESSKEAKYLVCSSCQCGFTSQENLNKHKLQHLPDESFCRPNGMKTIQCKICSSKFTKIYNLRKHFSISHLDVASFDMIPFDTSDGSEMAKGLQIVGDNLIEKIVEKMAMKDYSHLYSIINEDNIEMHISDSETESDDDDEEILRRIYSCEACQKCFDRKYKLLAHQKSEHRMEELEYSCGVCRVLFVSQSLLENHTKTQCSNPDKIIKCTKCPVKFTWLENFQKHMDQKHPSFNIKKKVGEKLTKNNDNIYPCADCQKIFHTIKDLKRHLVCHLPDDKKFKCHICDQIFNRRDNMRYHIIRMHGSQTGLPDDANGSDGEPIPTCYQCPDCPKTFQKEEQLTRHKRCHVPDDQKFNCEICQKKFNRKDNLRQHMKIHSDDKTKVKQERLLCTFCGRSFGNTSNLVVHIRRHTGEKPYKCEFCTKGFPRMSDLNSHRRTHTGEKPHLCTVCGKGFSRSNKLVRHIRIHTGDRPYKCTYCDRAFTQSNDLTLHIRRHTGDKPYVCGVCGDRFIQSSALQNHREMRGHFEDKDNPGPFSTLSAQNPNRLTASNRVDQYGSNRPRGGGSGQIKPVRRQGPRVSQIGALVSSNDELDSPNIQQIPSPPPSTQILNHSLGQPIFLSSSGSNQFFQIQAGPTSSQNVDFFNIHQPLPYGQHIQLPPLNPSITSTSANTPTPDHTFHNQNSNPSN